MIINKIEFSRDQIEKLALESSNKTEFAEKLGFTFFNGKISKKITNLLLELNINVNLESFFKKRKSLIKYSLIKKICPICNNEFETLLGHPKEKSTCSHSCSNTYFSSVRHTENSKEKTSKSLITYFKNNPQCHLTTNCITCGKEFKTTNWDINRNNNHCSKTCLSIDPVYRKKLSDAMQIRIKNGTHKGWAKRSNLKPSYPEKYIINLLEELNIVNFTRELKVNKWFIDFAFNNKVALEIDGKQHEFPERKTSDETKDLHLISQGWKVIRLKWKKPNKEFRDKVINLLLDIDNI